MKKTKTRHPKPGHMVDAADDALTEDASSTTEAPKGAEEVSVGDAQADHVASMQARIDKLEDSLLRAKADYQNLQRRAASERSQAIRYGNAEVFKGLLSVIDDFERALVAAEATENHDSVVQGVRLVYENFIKALAAQGLETIEALHQPFDPNMHEALLQQPSADHPAGTVIEEVAKGYRLHDRVLRPSRVVVSRAVEGDDASGEVQVDG